MKLLRSVYLALPVIVSLSARAQGQLGETVPNWTPPSSGAGFSVSGGLHLMSDVTSPVAFVGVTPCRVVDTRRAVETFGGPALAAASPRNFPIPSGPCAGIPSNAQAYSLNVTVTQTLGAGFLKMYPQGGSAPVVSTLNYVANETVANAAIVPAGSGGGITVVAGAAGTHLIIDINGYYGDTPNDPATSFRLFTDSVNPTIDLTNSSTDCGGSCGLRVYTHSGWAIEGSSLGFYGVVGSLITPAPDSAAVYGEAGVTDTFTAAPSGVRGESEFGFGVFGASSYQGVVGLLVDSMGGYRAEGDLGTTDGVNVWGVYSHGNFAATGVKSFVEPHPTDASRVIRYVALEGPESGTYFRGSGQIVDGRAVIEVPESFRIVTDEEGLTVQVTPIGELATMAVASRDLDRVVVLSSKDVAFDYLVHGVRRAFKDFQPVAGGMDFVPRSAQEKMPGYLTEEARRRLIANGTYNEDGTVNMATAERLGWVEAWADREAAIQAAAQTARAARDRPKP